MPHSHGSQNVVLDPLKLEFMDVSEPLCKFWGTNIGPLQEQQVRFTSEPTLQLPRSLNRQRICTRSSHSKTYCKYYQNLLVSRA